MSNRLDWLPDWRDKAQYPDHGEVHVSWAWEFLRRNSEYQSDWEFASGVEDEDYRALISHHLAVAWGFSLRKGARKSGALKLSLTNPASPQPPYFERVSPVKILRKLPNGQYSVGTSIQDPFMIYPILDLRRALTPQLDALEREFDKLARSLKKEGIKIGIEDGRPRFSMFRGYLRMLDAVANGYNLDAIATEFNLNFDTAKSRLRKAKKLAKHEYAEILRAGNFSCDPLLPWVDRDFVYQNMT